MSINCFGPEKEVLALVAALNHFPQDFGLATPDREAA